MLSIRVSCDSFTNFSSCKLNNKSVDYIVYLKTFSEKKGLKMLNGYSEFKAVNRRKTDYNFKRQRNKQ